MKRTIFFVLSMILFAILSGFTGCAPEPDTGWQWKQFQLSFDVMNFLNGTGPHQYPVKDARVTAVYKNRRFQFTVFYLPGQTEQPKGRWAWMKVTTPQQVVNHLNGTGPTPRPVEDARICVAWKRDHAEYYIFYKPGLTGPTGEPVVPWEWRKLTAVDQVVDFLNGNETHHFPASAARITALENNGAFEYHIFLKRGAGEESENTVGWKELKNSPAPDDVANYLNGREPYKKAEKDAEICAVGTGENTLYHIFPNRRGPLGKI